MAAFELLRVGRLSPVLRLLESVNDWSSILILTQSILKGAGAEWPGKCVACISFIADVRLSNTQLPWSGFYEEWSLGTDEVFGPEAERLAQGPDEWLEVRKVWDALSMNRGTQLPAMLRLARWQTQLPNSSRRLESHLEVLAIDANNLLPYRLIQQQMNRRLRRNGCAGFGMPRLAPMLKERRFKDGLGLC